MTRSSVLCAPALAALMLLSACGESQTQAATGGKAAPDFTLEAADGHKVTLSELRGQVVLLNFWATWCGPCKIEMPWFMDFQRKYKDRGFTVLAVSLDEGGWDVVRPYAEEMQFNFPVVVGSDEIASGFGEFDALPTTFVLDKDGKIVASHTGLVDRATYEEEIEKLL
jgi:cytochrome c biogenesis protein CcmG/thiol:disulfide interchange protein DsbE